MKRGLMILFILSALLPPVNGQVLVYEGFEGTTFPPNGWTIVNNGSGNDWTQNTNITYAASGTKSMMYTFTSSAPAAAWAFTPAMQLDSADSVTITFDQRVGLPNLAEALRVTVGNAQTVTSQTTVLYNNNNLTNTQFIQRTATFIANATGSYYFAFNCYSAVDRYKLFVDNIRIAKPVLTDAKLLSLTIPASGCTMGASEPISITIKNNGVDTISNFQVNYVINGSPPISETILTDILPGASLPYTFTTTADLSNPGNYTIKAYSGLTNDDDPYNDTLTQQTEHIAGGIPVKSSDEIVFIPDNSPVGASSFITFCGLPANLDGTGVALDFLKIDSINHSWISDLNIYLSSPSNDSLLISAGNGGGSPNIINATFTDSASTNVATINSGGIPAGFYHTESTLGLAKFHTGQNPNGSWKLKVVDNQTGDIGKICKWTLAFKAFTGIHSEEESDVEKLWVYPNPTNGTITIVSKKNCEVKVKLLNTSGQEVCNESTKSTNSGSLQMELGKYGKGMYFLQVISEDRILTRKIIVN